MAFVLRSLGICGVVAALALRYFWLRASWQARAEAEVRARLEALQARIEPHFLFNTLNSAAALTATAPHAAETALEDLAALLRARLAHETVEQVALAEEMTLVAAYVRIEKLRLGARLSFTADVDAAAEQARLPALTIQPLVENAIGHGVARRADGGRVQVIARCTRQTLTVTVINPVADQYERGLGHRQAVDNIRDRLELAYGHQASLEFSHDACSFIVTLVVPQPESDDMT